MEKKEKDHKQLRQSVKDEMSTSVSPIANTLHCEKFVKLNNVKFLVYGNVIQTKGIVNGKNSVTRNAVFYRLQRRDVDNKVAMARVLNVNPISQRFKYNEAISQELQGLNRKYSNFSGVFEYGDLSMMIFRLGQALACYRSTGTLSWTDCMAGHPLKIRALAVLDDPVCASNNHVFIPRNSSMIDFEATFSALVMAANSTGADVVTDVVAMTTSNAPTITAYNDGELAQGCFNALRIIFSMMEMCGAGAVASFALTKGLHDICTVAGHTDEGSYFRDVIRRQNFMISYGGIYTSMASSYMGLPVPTSGSLSSYSALVDAILLKTAAVVAISDPCEEIGGRVYPSVFTSTVAVHGHGQNNEGTDADALDLMKRIGANSGLFCENYITNVAKLFQLHGSEETASNFLNNCYTLRITTPNRHLKYNTVAPWYWIEPTGLFSHKTSTIANSNGFGVLVGTEEPDFDMDIFEEFEVYRSNVSTSYVKAKFRSARTSGLILHHALNDNDGLGAVSIQQASFDQFVLRGGINEDIGVSIQNRRNLADYLWQRGDGGIPAPAELTYIAEAMMFKMVHLQFDENDIPVVDGCRNSKELNLKYSISVAKPYLIGEKEIGERTREVRRSRTAAADALTKVHGWIKNGWETGGDEVVLGNMVPTFMPRRNDFAQPGTTDHEKAEKVDENTGIKKSGPSVPLSVQDQPLKNRLPNSIISTTGIMNSNDTGQLPNTEHLNEQTQHDAGPHPEV